MAVRNIREVLAEPILGTLAGKSVKAFWREVPELRYKGGIG